MASVADPPVETQGCGLCSLHKPASKVGADECRTCATAAGQRSGGMSAHGPSQLQLCTCCNASCVLVTQEDAADVLANVKKLEKYDKVKHTTFFSV